jgi:hypothetical protein
MSKIIKFIKQLFCRHSWNTKIKCFPMENGFIDWNYLECSKCGKEKSIYD